VAAEGSENAVGLTGALVERRPKKKTTESSKGRPDSIPWTRFEKGKGEPGGPYCASSMKNKGKEKKGEITKRGMKKSEHEQMGASDSKTQLSDTGAQRGGSRLACQGPEKSPKDRAPARRRPAQMCSTSKRRKANMH